MRTKTDALEADVTWYGPIGLDRVRDGVFTRSMGGALTLLVDAPAVGRTYPDAGIPGLRRLMLPASRHHIYYVHDSTEGEVIVLAIWSAVRGSGPRLRLP